MDKNRVIQNFQDLHQIPELSWEEYKTTIYIYEELKKIGYSPKILSKKLGVVADLNPRSKRKIALRADMDALPIREDTDLQYKADKNMHACGHDGHMTVALGTARELYKIKNSIDGGIRFIFQPSEENGEGADYMIEEGVLDGIEAIFGCHIWGTLPIGEVNIEEGPRMASCDNFYIDIDGTGAHGAEPHLGADAVLAGSHLVVALQQVVSRNIAPLKSGVITVGTINGGNRYNIVADKVRLEGTSRTLDEGVRDTIEERIKEITEYVLKGNRCSGVVKYDRVADPLVNDRELTKYVKEEAGKIEGIIINESFDPLMAAEDFGRYGRNIPSTFVFIGTRDESRGLIYPNHHPKFQVVEEALYQGIDIFTRVLKEYF